MVGTGVAGNGLPILFAGEARILERSSAGLEDEQDAGENLTVVQGRPAGEAEAARGRGRQQRLEALPQRVGNKG